jgi:hypothetical protein
MDMFPVAVPKSYPVPAAGDPVLPDPNAPGVTWYVDAQGNLIPGAGTYYDIVAQNIDDVITVADSINDGTLGQAVTAAGDAANSATAAANSASAALTSQNASAGSATVASNASTTAQTSATNAGTSATNAGTSATNAAASATSAGNSATSANNYWHTFNAIWYGPYATAPTLDPFGQAITQGDVYFDTTLNALRVWDGTSWVGVPAGISQPQADARYVQLAGSTLTGPLVLAANPAAPLQPVTLQYYSANTPAASSTLPLIDGTAAVGTGTTFARADHVHPAAPGGVTISDTAPATPKVGDLWWDSVGAQLYLWYNDGTSTQWVPATAIPASIGEAPTDGNAYGRRSGVWTNLATVPQLQADVGRNLLHNALFNVAQRGTGPWTASGYTADRWQMFLSLDTVQYGMIALSDTSRAQIGDEVAYYSLSNIFTGNAGAAASNYLTQKIENVRRLAGKTVTISFWASSSAALKIGINIQQYFGTGGSPSVSVWALATGVAIITGTTFQRFTVTIPLPSISGKVLGSNGDDFTWLFMFYSSGANNNTLAGNIGVQSGTIQLWGIQLEIGSVATPLEKVDPGEDLRRCQRFFLNGTTQLNAYGGAGSGFTTTAYFPVAMRAPPTIAIISTPVLVNVTGVASLGANAQSVVIQGVATATAASAFSANFTASADL